MINVWKREKERNVQEKLGAQFDTKNMKIFLREKFGQIEPSPNQDLTFSMKGFERVHSMFNKIIFSQSSNFNF